MKPTTKFITNTKKKTKFVPAAVSAAVLVCLTCLTAGASPAADSQDVKSSSWTETLTSGLSSGWEKVTGLFTGSDDASSSSSSDQAQETLPGYLAENWEKLTDSLSGALSLRDRQDKLPDSSWFGSDKESNAKKINGLLDAALEILAQGEAGEMRRDAAALQASISELRREADKLRNQRITAPESSKLPWRKTRAKIDERLAEVEQEIRDNEAELAAIHSRLTDALRKTGLELEPSQVDVFFSSMTGDDLLQNAVVFTNVKAVVEKLEELSQHDQNDLEITRRYTGMYLVLNDLLIYTQDALVHKIDGEYRPRLDELMKEVRQIQDDARNKSRQTIYTEAQRKAFALNVDANALTLQVASLYVELLNAQRKDITASLQDLRHNRDLAENTYRTVKNSGELRNLICSGLEHFDNIHALSLPRLRPFESQTLRKEFEEINKRLKR